MKCELLKIEQVIGETIMQATISETLRVPESKPGVEQIVSVDGFVRIRRIEVIEDKIIVHGRLHVGVVYVGLLDSKPIHYTHERIEFTQFAEFPVACPEWWREWTPGSWTSRHNAIRPIIICAPDMYEIIALVEVNARVTQMQEINVLVEPDPGVSATTQRVRVEEIITTGQLQDIIQGSFMVPEEKPGIERILDVGAEVFVVETKIVDGQAIIEADAHLQFMYVGLTDKGNQPVHHMHHRYHFTEFVPLPDLAAKVQAYARQGPACQCSRPDRIPVV